MSFTFTACIGFAQTDDEFFEDCGYRCTPFQSCIFENQKLACHYGSASATSGGIVLKNGSEFFVEWFAVSEDSSTSINGEGHALINDVKTRYKISKVQSKNDELRCVQFYKDNTNDILFAYGSC